MSWPRLSTDLNAKREYGVCQSCGATKNVSGWQEHDDQDKPEFVAVMLCESCSKRLIEPHPRLYRRMVRWEPFPGAMETCSDCLKCSNLTCNHPDLKANGGDGLKMNFPRPAAVIACTRPGCFSQKIYYGPVVCEGKKARDK